MNNMLPLSKDEFNLFQKLLIEESGLYFDKNKSQSLNLILWERVQKGRYGSYREYYDLLKSHPEGNLELRRLFDLITIDETYFFRYSPQFEALMKFMLPEIIQRKRYSPDRSIRIWSAGCSKGDEPYSIAIALMEVLSTYRNWEISILGTDINRDTLLCAKEAVYGKKDISHIPKEYFDKYFEKRGKNYVLDKNVKKLVRFEYHNLAKDPFILDGMQNLDIIFCRNVIIYFDLQVIKRLIDNFYNTLNQDGYLFLGHAETLWQITDKFETVEFPKTFVYKKVHYSVKGEFMKPFMGVPEIRLEEFVGAEKTPLVKRLPKALASVTKSQLFEKNVKPFEVGQENIDALYQKATKFFNKKNYEEAISLFDKVLAQDKNHIPTYLGKATILANQEKYEEAVGELKKIIAIDNLSAEAFYLLGVLSYRTGNFKEAEMQFRKVLYIDSDIALAYYNLGNIYLYQKKYNKAVREFNNAVRLLEKKPMAEQVRFCEDFTVEYLLRVCKNNLTKMKINEERRSSV